MPHSPMQTPSVKKKRISPWSLVAFAGVVLLLVLIAMRLFKSDSMALSLGGQPKDFTLTTFDGEVIHTADLRGQVVLINFWASWCGTCDEETNLLEQAWRSFQAEGDEEVVFLGVAYMDTEPASQSYLSDHGVTFPNGPDLRGAISRIYQVNSVPETFILDADGVLRYLKIGPFSSLDEIQAAVEQVLAQPVDEQKR